MSGRELLSFSIFDCVAHRSSLLTVRYPDVVRIPDRARFDRSPIPSGIRGKCLLARL
jgi:hypothetical protein